MSDTTTPILGLVQPAVGGSSDTWGNKQNTNETIIDNYASEVNSQLTALWNAIGALQAGEGALGMGYQEPVGTVKWWPSNHDYPPGYVIADGSWISTSQWPDLFAVLGSLWGGDGVNNYALPDLRGFVLVGMDMGTGRLQGQYGPDQFPGYGGVATVTLQSSQVPPHAHSGATDYQGYHAHNVPTPANLNAGAGPYPVPVGGYGYYGEITDTQGLHYHNIGTDVQGGGGAHTNCQPGVLGFWIIKAVLI